jgi:hypothetical protein
MSRISSVIGLSWSSAFVRDESAINYNTPIYALSYFQRALLLTITQLISFSGPKLKLSWVIFDFSGDGASGLILTYASSVVIKLITICLCNWKSHTNEERL